MAITTRRMARRAEEAEHAAQEAALTTPTKEARTSRKSATADLADASEPASHAQTSPLPPFWYAFFGIVEPVSTLSGAVLALAKPAQFYLDQVPKAFILPDVVGDLPPVPPPPAAGMAIAQLGSCYLLLTLNSSVFFHVVKKHVRDPLLLQTLVQALLVVLGIADWIHIVVTLLTLPTPLGAEPGLLPKLQFLLQPTSWNPLLFGNVVITLILFLFRAAWLAGVGRASITATEEKEAEPVTPKKRRGRPAKTPKSE